MTVRTRRTPSLNWEPELVLVSVNRTVIHNNGRMTLFFYHNFLGFMKSTTRGERTIPMLPSTGAESRGRYGSGLSFTH